MQHISTQNYYELSETGIKEPIQLAEYFQRIGFHEDPLANVATLKKLQFLHTTTIPFENLNPLLSLPVNLDTQTLWKKLILGNRGGFCFEQNLVFLTVLKQIGFQARGLMARVLWNLPDNRITVRTHMLILVNIDGAEYLSDVGFGRQTPTGPLLFKIGEKQKTPHEYYRIIEGPYGYLLQTCVAGKWRNVYSFTLEPQFFVDFKVAGWYAATHPDSHFTKDLIIVRADEGRRHVLHNSQFNTYYLDGKTEKISLKNTDDIREIITNIFNIEIPETGNIEAVLNQVLGRTVVVAK